MPTVVGCPCRCLSNENTKRSFQPTEQQRAKKRSELKRNPDTNFMRTYNTIYAYIIQHCFARNTICTDPYKCTEI